MSAESQRQRPTDDDQQLEHVSILAGAGARINADEFWRGSGLASAMTPVRQTSDRWSARIRTHSPEDGWRIASGAW